MAVVVVRADADHGEASAYRGDESAIGVRAAVMGHFENIRAQVDAGTEKALLRGQLSVAGKQDPPPGHLRPQHQG
jgi:hypothetical protein